MSIIKSDPAAVTPDGIMKDVNDVPRGNRDWEWDNPADAAIQFVKERNEFELEQPSWPFNESSLSKNITHWPGAWLKKL